MISFVVRRLLIAVPTLLIVATLTFFLTSLVPGDPANYILGQSATPESVAALHAQLGLDQPVLVQYWNWLSSALHGDLGTSVLQQEPVTTLISQAIGATLSLAVLSTLAAVAIGMALGTWAAVKGGRTDTLLQTAAGVGVAIPSYWMAAVLVLVFAIGAGWFPSGGYTPITESAGGWALALVLPAAAIAINAVCQVLLQARAGVLDVLSRDYVRTLQSTGLPRWRVLGKHVVRNAAVPVIQVAAATFFYAVSGVVVIEKIFNLNGLGSLLLSSATQRDLSTVLGATLVFSVMVLVANIVIDVLAALVNPRIRVS
ncbi:MAG TPA: ABC transporter permease [Cellulomonas sp.]